ncbi:evbL [Pseudonocardia ailaonensis]|uniref:EvbL n=1 Tax=Pseudonocardia ailaonensis TaxID=367279 RepID=A0ABN2MJI1_9PSEU
MSGPTPTAVAEQTARAIQTVPARFMVAAETHSRAAELGYTVHLSFQVCGRGGVLGEVDADVVAAGMVFMHPAVVRRAWDAGAAVLPRPDAAGVFADSAHVWARRHLTADPAWDRLAELAERVVRGAHCAAAPVFAGWRSLPVPGDGREAAVHHLNGLRELRAARHAVGVLAAGLVPGEAVCHRHPGIAPDFGWSVESDLAGIDPEDCGRRWAAAEATTDELFARDLSILDGPDLEEFSTLAQRLHSELRGRR